MITWKRPTAPRLALGACLSAIVLIGAGCGDSKPPLVPASGPTTEARAAPPAAKAIETPQQAQTSGNVQIGEEIRRACGISDTDAYFAFDSTRLQSRDLVVLNKVATCFSSGPLKGKTLRLVGRADPRGPSDYNMMLGHSRADSVAGYLNGKGLDKSKTESTSRGAMDATGNDESGWSKDRRVDLLLGGS